MLTSAEEILLLLLDEERGTVVEVSALTLHFALAGAVIMDLALADRLDSDLQRLSVVDATPTGDALLDRVLARIAADSVPGQRDARSWIETIGREGEALKRELLDRLVARGILMRVDEKILWVFESRRYPLIDDQEVREVRARLRAILFADDLPDPRDIVLICLADACALFDQFLDARERAQAAPRIAQLRRMDLVGQAMARVIRDIQTSIAVLIV